jgi:hypothetical protein
MVWVVSIVLGLMAVSQIVILSSLFVLESSSPAVRHALASSPPFDWLTLYVLAGILLTSMVFLFRLRRRAVSWFAVYIGLASWVALGYAIAPDKPPYFDELPSLGGMLVALIILSYMRRLRQLNVLR